MSTVNSFGARTALEVGGRTVQMFILPVLQAAGFPEIASLPYSIKILLENLLRNEDGVSVTKGASWMRSIGAGGNGSGRAGQPPNSGICSPPRSTTGSSPSNGTRTSRTGRSAERNERRWTHMIRYPPCSSSAARCSYRTTARLPQPLLSA